MSVGHPIAMETNVSNDKGDKIDGLCEDCGVELSAFLHEMADHNAKVTACPKCGKHHPYVPPKTAKAPARVRSRKSVKKVVSI
jgi:hypothetical protein